MTLGSHHAFVARDSDILEGGLYGREIDNVSILLVRLNGVVHAIGRICTHEDADLAEGRLEDGCVVCPLHGSKFDLETGRALTLPAIEPEPVYEVVIEDGSIYVAIPEGEPN